MLDNAPAHPSTSRLCSKDGCIKTLFLPSNSTSMIQPMDQGIIESAKRHFRNMFLEQCLVVVEDRMDLPGYVDCRAKKTKEKFKAYTVKDAIFNWSKAWKKTTLRNGWCKLLKTLNTPAVDKDDFEEFETSRMVDMMHQAGQGEIEQELVDWVQVL